jgi:hypothetical protein
MFVAFVNVVVGVVVVAEDKDWDDMELFVAVDTNFSL